jgi:hypothetical protein
MLIEKVVDHPIDLRAIKSSVSTPFNSMELDRDTCLFQGFVEKLTLIMWDSMVLVAVYN